MATKESPWFPPEIAQAVKAAGDEFRVAPESSLEALSPRFVPPGSAEGGKHELRAERKGIKDSQKALYASKRFSVLAIFQALDAAGKDGAIREVFEGVNPAGLRVSAFKAPSEIERRHDFLWRTSNVLPRKGKIGIFNRSYYEEVLVVQAHPEFLNGQYAGKPPELEPLWKARYRAIREHELHLATANTLVLKFWLDVSPARQAKRFLERLEVPEKQWKFSSGDVRESRLRPEYNELMMKMFQETSRPWAPWFCIPADDRWFARWKIAGIINRAIAALPLEYPQAESLSEEETEAFHEELSARVNETPVSS